MKISFGNWSLIFLSVLNLVLFFIKLISDKNADFNILIIALLSGGWAMESIYYENR